MRRTGLLLTALVLSFATVLPGFAKSKDKVEHKSFSFDGKDRTYYYQIPTATDANKPLPAVVLLHAQGGWATDVIGMWHDFASHEGFVIIAPESLSNTMWNSTVDGPNYLHAVVAEVNKMHPIDPQRVFLFGEDSGGVYAMALGLFDSQFWGSTCVHRAILDPSNYSLFQHAQRKEPFQVWVGDQDPDHSLNLLTNEYHAFKNAGFPFDLKIIQNSSGGYGGNVADQVNEGCYHFFSKNPNTAASPAAPAAPATPPAAPSGLTATPQ